MSNHGFVHRRAVPVILVFVLACVIASCSPPPTPQSPTADADAASTPRNRVTALGRLEPDVGVIDLGAPSQERILELKVDHFLKGGGKTHAPVPFYVSNRGYGVLFDTAGYLKVHVQVGSRKDSPNNPPEVDRNPRAEAARFRAVQKLGEAA